MYYFVMKYQFPEKLKELRLERNLSTRQLANALNNRITKTTICNWEAGITIPNFESVIIIAEYFGVTTDYFAGKEY